MRTLTTRAPRFFHVAALPCAVVAIASFTIPALGQMTYLSQNRVICATASEFGFGVPLPGTGPLLSAPDFAPFDESVSITIPLTTQLASNNGFARQASSLLPTAIYFDGAAGGLDNNPSNGVGQGYGYCLVDVQFSLSAPTFYFCSWNLTGNPGLMAAFPGVARLLAANNSVIFAQTPGVGNSGVLLPGTYRYQFEIAAGGSGTGISGGSTTFTGSFLVPAPASGTLALLAIGACSRRRVRR